MKHFQDRYLLSMNSISFCISACLDGMESRLVKTEISIKKGVPRFNIVGLAGSAVREAPERVRIAIENSGYFFPLMNILVNLSPAGIRKDSAFLDLAIAAGILSRTGQIFGEFDWEKILFLGELGLDGSIRPMKGISNILCSVDPKKFDKIILPSDNRYEAGFFQNLNLFPVQKLSGLEDILSGRQKKYEDISSTVSERVRPYEISLFNDQIPAMENLIVSAAGKHHSLFIGSPGCGKTMLARFIPNLLPELSTEEFSEILRIRSVSDNENISFFSKERPFRSPHHTASDVSVIGGGKTQKLGEVTLAHNGVLFLDELGEFKSPLIQALREPLEDEHVTVSRINYHVTYPASFLLVAASNPCPCGYSGSVSRNCICSEIRIQKYLGKFSGPFLDRIDITAEMYSLEERDRSISIFPLEETYRRIENAFLIQTERYRKLGCRFNGSLKGQDIDKYIIMDNGAEKIFQSLFQKRNLSIRRLQKIKKISRTNADLDGSENVREEHVFKALSLTKPFQFPMLAA